MLWYLVLSLLLVEIFDIWEANPIYTKHLSSKENERNNDKKV